MPPSLRRPLSSSNQTNSNISCWRKTAITVQQHAHRSTQGWLPWVGALISRQSRRPTTLPGRPYGEGGEGNISDKKSPTHPINFVYTVEKQRRTSDWTDIKARTARKHAQTTERLLGTKPPKNRSRRVTRGRTTGHPSIAPFPLFPSASILSSVRI